MTQFQAGFHRRKFMKKDVQRITILAALVMVFGMVMSACQQGTQPATDSGATGPQTLSAVSKDIVLDPTQAQDDDTKKVVEYLYEPLMGTDQGKPATWLVKSWTVAEDKLAYTFELRSDVKFSDGTPLNADVVVATFTSWFDASDPAHGTGAYKGWLDTFSGFKGETDSDGKKKSSFDGAEKTGDYTVVLHLNRPVDTLLTALESTNFYITKPSADGKSLVGTGPYMVGTRNDQHLVLVTNPNYNGPYPATGDLEIPFK
jgi:peptide/nickel transport system substrate-binding protein